MCLNLIFSLTIYFRTDSLLHVSRIEHRPLLLVVKFLQVCELFFFR